MVHASRSFGGTCRCKDGSRGSISSSEPQLIRAECRQPQRHTGECAIADALVRLVTDELDGRATVPCCALETFRAEMLTTILSGTADRDESRGARRCRKKTVGSRIWW